MRGGTTNQQRCREALALVLLINIPPESLTTVLGTCLEREDFLMPAIPDMVGDEEDEAKQH